MKAVWICNVPLPRIAHQLRLRPSPGSGWLDGLFASMQNQLEIVVVFRGPTEDTGEVNGLRYYTFIEKHAERYDSYLVDQMKDILREEHPDVVHVFGSEYPHTLAVLKACESLGLLEHTVVSIQGLISYIAQPRHFLASLPSRVVHGWTLHDLLTTGNLSMQQRAFAKRGEYEVQALQKARHVMGRTDWDYAAVKRIQPDAHYHFCNETLRESFYSGQWNLAACKPHSILVSQAGAAYKGFHFVLEALPDILRRYPDAHVYVPGRSPLQRQSLQWLRQTNYSRYLAGLLRKNRLTDHVTFLGPLDEQQMHEQFLQANVFVLSSSIENSPNSLGEAMLLGVPAVAADVGGVSTLMQHQREGYIYQHDAPYMLAHYIMEVFERPDYAAQLAREAQRHARQTHDRANNAQVTLEIYHSICRE